MKKYILLLFGILFLYQNSFAVPSNTLSITPVAVDATTITASDENTRNNTIVSIYNAHSHNDISQFGNNLNIGDSLAGNKTIFFYNADSNKPFLRYDDTNNYWIFSTDGVASSVILQESGLIFEGATDNDYETTFSITEPTADRVITFPNSDINFVTGLPVANGGTGSTTSSGARTALSAATLGANSDITSLSGLTTALTTGQGGTGSTAAANAAGGVVVPTGAVNAANGAVVLDASGYLPDSSVDTTALKTSTGEVSTTGVNTILTLPGGSYGFYPQLKAASGTQSDYYVAIGGVPGANAGSLGTTYTTQIGFYNNTGVVISAQQRYVTASGEDMWIFLLLDKTTKNIIAAYQAPDAPHFGNGGDYNKVPHPFANYKSDIQEIVLLDKKTCLALKTESKQTGKSILTLVNESYKADMSKEEIYEPLHSGKFLDEDNKLVKEMVKTIPDYIKVRKLIKK